MRLTLFYSASATHSVPSLPIHRRMIAGGIFLLLASLAVFGSPAMGADGAAQTAEIPQMTLQVSGPAWQLAVSPDGRYLAAADATAVVVWDLTTGAIVRRIPGSYNPFFGFRFHFSPDSRRLFISVPEQPLILDMAKGTLESVSQPGRMAWLIGDGQQFWSVSRDDEDDPWKAQWTFTRYDRARGKTDRTMTCRLGNFWKISPNCSFLINSAKAKAEKPGDSGEQIIHEVWDLNAGKRIAHLDSARANFEIQTLAFTADGQHCAARCMKAKIEDSSINVFDLHTGAITQKLIGGPLYSVDAIAFNGDGTQLAMAGETGDADADKQIVLWDVASGKLLHKLAHSNGRVGTLAFSPDGTRLWAASAHGPIDCWNLGTETVDNTLTPPLAPCFPIAALTPDARRLAIGTSDSFFLWDLTLARPINHWLPKEKLQLGWPPNCISLSPDGRRVIAALNEPFRLIAWDTVTGAISQTESSQEWETASFSPDGKRAASTTTTWNGTGLPSSSTMLWDTDGWKKIRPLPMKYLYEFAWSHDGSKLAWLTSTDDESTSACTIYDIASGRQKAGAPIAHLGEDISSPSFSADDKVITLERSAKHQRTLVQINSTTGKIV
ncbi:MAG TPA: WD40 repeat domain-containing protein, partial [Armatimonadota bacterium]